MWRSRIIAPALALGLMASGAGAEVGADLTTEEIAGFREAVLACWSVPPRSPEARIAVTLAFAMDRAGRPRAETIRLTGQKGGASSAEIALAFDNARHALLRCGGEGYALPVEKYENWKNIVMEFVPLHELTER
ncbi:MAG: hypothetical protein ACK5IP_02055 [Paracoccus sp. (in: a-proteobacteria)]